MENIITMKKLAQAAQTRAYAPYSNFYVGCSLRSVNNLFYAGCNVENVSYGVTLCAETSAIGHFISAGEREIAEILVIGSGQLLVYPCGRCRQQLAEFAHSSTPVHVCNHAGDHKTLTLGELIPFVFDQSMMVKE